MVGKQVYIAGYSNSTRVAIESLSNLSVESREGETPGKGHVIKR